MAAIKGKALVVLGAQWGDEGKGKCVDLLAEQADVVARCQGGSNAGHTVVVDGVHYDFHLLPSGIVYKDATCVIGNGVVVHIPSLFYEIDKNREKGLEGIEDRLVISNRAHIVSDIHQLADGWYELEKKGNSLGTTKKGIGPSYSSKMLRNNIRMSDLLGDRQVLREKFENLINDIKKRFPEEDIDFETHFASLEALIARTAPMIKDSVVVMHQALDEGKSVLVEGANAAMLDIDFGTYPFVTSSNCTIGGVCTGLGIPPNKIGNVIGVVKAYTTRVGAGHFPTELVNDTGNKMADIGHEYGVTTGRRRRCGWLDLVVVKYSAMVNGLTSLAVTKLDILDTFEELKVCVDYKIDGVLQPSFPADHADLAKVECIYTTMPGWNTSTVNCRAWDDLPQGAKAYLELIASVTKVPIGWIGVGQSRDSIIVIK